MKRVFQSIVLTALLLTLVSSSCETNNVGELITGTWRCQEESNRYGSRQYSVNIDYSSEIDTTLFVIYNFHNLGFEVETYVRLKDTVITILQTNGMYGVVGKGYVSKDFKRIDWEYNIDDEYVKALYYRK